MFAKEGYPFILSFAIALIVVVLLPKTLLIIVIAILLGLMLWFFRDPKRAAPHDTNSVVSAADGKVVEIGNVEIDGIRYNKVSVFMNVFSVHVNRAPFDGKVVLIKHIDGTFLPADKKEASTQNERCEIHFDTGKGKIIAVQVAGLIARRTVQYIIDGESVVKGDRIGMIKFSSRVDHYLPENVELKIGMGDTVIAGVTIIGQFND